MSTPDLNSTCVGGSECCRVPPCLCGTYISCEGTDPSCLSASCEPCPAGYYCTCVAACSRSGGLSLARSCPAGYFCPGGSGSPSPCAAGTYLTRPFATSSSACQSCAFATSSAPGSTSCALTTTFKIGIGCGIPGLFLLLAAAYGCVRACRARRARAVAEFEREYLRGRAGPAVPTHAWQNGDDDRAPSAPSGQQWYAGPSGVLSGDSGGAPMPPRATAADKRSQLEQRMAAAAAANGIHPVFTAVRASRFPAVKQPQQQLEQRQKHRRSSSSINTNNNVNDGQGTRRWQQWCPAVPSLLAHPPPPTHPHPRPITHF